MNRIYNNMLSLKTHTPSELMGMKVIWKRNLLGVIKGVEIEFNEDHAAAINGVKTLFLSKGENIDLRKNVSGVGPIPYFTCSLLSTGRMFISTETICYENNSNEFLKKFGGVDFAYKTIYFTEYGVLGSIITHTFVDSIKLINRKAEKHIKYWNENTLFDRIMKKYFSFYK